MASRLRAALIDQAVSVGASLAMFAAVYLVLRPELRRELAVAAAGRLHRLSGGERRAWLRSPAAEFARRRRDLLLEQEWEPDEVTVP